MATTTTIIPTASLHREIIEPMTDQEFLASFHASLEREQTQIDEAIARGASFVLSAANKLHTLQCKNSGFHPSRREAWERYLPGGEPDHIRAEVAHGSGGPRMQPLLTHEEVLRLRNKYERCAICTPDVPEHPGRRPTVYDRSWAFAMLARAVESKSRPAVALDAVLELHAPSADHCSECLQPYPCGTVVTAMTAFGVDADLI